MENMMTERTVWVSTVCAVLCVALPLMGQAEPAAPEQAAPIEVSSFGKSLVPGKFILPAKKGWWNWGRPEISYNTDAHCFGKELSRTERPHILWKDGKPEYLFLANHGSREAGFYLKIEGWDPPPSP